MNFFKRGFLTQTLIAVFILMPSNLFSKELYNDGTCSLSIEEISEGCFKVSCCHENEKIEFCETSPAKYKFHWVSEDLARLDFGSPFAPDVRSYFFSRKLKKISKRKDFATSVLDLKNLNVLCADIEVAVEGIFSDYKKTVNLPADIFPCAYKFFAIDEKSRLADNDLKLFYLADDESVKCVNIKIE
ncbi:MAG: hypothetical protein K2N58_10975 [Treponemataceae bacterium]|nr:hypothetical protein [Treponemataceae bacterium]